MFFFKQKTAYEMRISDWSSDVCSSDLATFRLEAHKYPHKLHTVGQPAPGHIAKVIGEDGTELPQGAVGEIVGRSAAMMTGYNNRPDATRAMHWHDAEGRLFYRHGDIGRLYEDG